MSVVANVAVNVDSRGAAQKLRALDTQARKTESAFAKLGGVATKLAGAFALAGAVKFVFAKTAELESQTRSLEVLTGSAEKAGKIIKELKDIGRVTPFTSTELIESAKRLNAFGVSTEKVVETTKRLGDVSGATGAELSGLVTAYGQVQAKGKLQGEELLQFQERGVALQKELREMYKLSGEEFQDALSKGKISAKAVEVAVKRLTDAGGKYANGAIAQSDTLSGLMSTLQDNVQTLAQTIGAVLAPELKNITRIAIEGLNYINRQFEAAAMAQQLGLKGPALQKLAEQADKEAEELVNLRDPRGRMSGFERSGLFNALRQQRLNDLLKQYGYTSGLLQAEVSAPMAEVDAIPELLGGGGSEKGSRKGSRKGSKKEEKDAYADIRRELERALLLGGEKNEFDKQLLQNAFDLEDQYRQINETVKAGGQEELKQLALKRRLQKDSLTLQEAAAAFGADAGAELAEKLPKANKELTETQKLIKELGSNVQSALASSIASAVTGFVEGTKTVQESLSDMFGAIAKAFLNMAAQIIAQQLVMITLQSILKALGGGLGGSGDLSADFGAAVEMGGSTNLGIDYSQFATTSMAFPGRANGGPVNANRPYMVGERGPELFIPFQRGQVASSEDTEQLLSEMQSVKLPFTHNAESASAMQGNSAIKVKYESTVVNGVEYVTADQHRKGMAEAAERGRALTLQALQNSPRTRTKVGI